MDGTGRHTFREFFKGRTGQNLAVFNGLFYWVDDRRLWQAPANQPSQKKFVLKGELTTIMVFHELQQPQGMSVSPAGFGSLDLNVRCYCQCLCPTGLSPCRKSGCQLCMPSLTSPSGFTCSCPEGRLPVQYGSCECRLWELCAFKHYS